MLTAEQMDEVNFSQKGGLVDKLSFRARVNMHKEFIRLVNPGEHETILDVGASAMPAYTASNFLESVVPPQTITAVGLGEDNPIWHEMYPGVEYIQGNALDLPFEDNAYDIVYSHAVIEHVGNFANQVQLIREAIRVAKRAVWITTPYRWHPVEFHTVLPLLHWLPKKLHRYLLTKFGREFFAKEEVLNLLDYTSLSKAVSLCDQEEIKDTKIHMSRFLGFKSNMLLYIDVG